MIIVFFLVGCVAGFANNVLGVGGGTIIIPLLTLANVPIKDTVHVSVINIAFASILSLFTKIKIETFRMRDFVWIGIPSIIFTQLGVLLHAVIDTRMLLTYIAFLYIALAVYFFFNTEKPAFTRAPVNRIQRNIFSIAIGSAAGIIIGLTGIGGATLIIPFLIIFCHDEYNAAAATALVIILANALVSSSAFLIQYSLPWIPLIALLAGSALGVGFGYLIAKFIPKKIVLKLFALYLFAAAVILFFR